MAAMLETSSNAAAEAHEGQDALESLHGVIERLLVVKTRHIVIVNGRPWVTRNTNTLVGAQGWAILLSKTGFTNEAGRCLVMRVQTAGRTVIVVLMGAARMSVSRRDALNIRRWLGAEVPAVAEPGATAHL